MVLIVHIKRLKGTAPLNEPESSSGIVVVVESGLASDNTQNGQVPD